MTNLLVYIIYAMVSRHGHGKYINSSLFTSSRPCLAKLQAPVFSALSMCGFIEFPMTFIFNFGKVSSGASVEKQLPIRLLHIYVESTIKLI